MTRLIHDVAELQAWRAQKAGQVGFVPTMGALHAGHAALLRQARAGSDAVVLSVFVNRTQFNDPADYARYPVTLEADRAIAESEGVDVLFAPEHAALYPDDYRYVVNERDLSTRLCGAHRPGHFDGVLTVVLKLLQLVRPQRAWFGEKDYQQLALIRGMVEAFFLPAQIIGVPTVREADGLALSSRNLRLTSEQRAVAPRLYAILRDAATAQAAIAALTEAGFRVDYVDDLDGRRYAAAFLGDVRLIDNIPLP
ncbi:MAG: pantoate--beta-alanine ligase [Pseudoxanthomonas suwonensis]|nr:MAG: pantoate--beta-alanine ligase [Pseudoxanthomonas suwonensis]